MQKQISIYPLGCEPFCVNGSAVWDDESHQVELVPGPDMEIPECRHCQRRMHIHSHHLVSLRTMPVGNHTVCWWNVHYRRFICPECGRTEYDSIPFHYVGDGTSGAKVTVEFARYVWRRLDGSNIRSVADSLRLRWGTVKSIELFYMRQVLSMAGIPRTRSSSGSMSCTSATTGESITTSQSSHLWTTEDQSGSATGSQSRM